MIFFVTGASGSGKTACMPELATLLPEVALHDLDELGVPPAAANAWRQQATEAWLQRGIASAAEGRDVVVCGQAVLGEILACPSAERAGPIAVCLLDCDDVLRVDRLRARGTHGATQDTLSWSAWLRVHSVDPSWRSDVIQDGAWPALRWDRWAGWKRGDPRWSVTVVDTSALTLAEAAGEVARWVRAVRAGLPFVPAADTPSPLLEHDPAREAFIEPSRTIATDPAAVAAIEATLRRRGVDHRRGRTWTTDAFYRETPGRIARRRAEGCCTVEMEAAALFAVARHRGKKLGVLLYAGDDLSGAAWNARSWDSHSGREALFWLAVEACLAIA
jgi:hypothetical protein